MKQVISDLLNLIYKKPENEIWSWVEILIVVLFGYLS
jgi:hypothetical protein